ncbi:MAG TPA: hypothetical protein VFW44_01185 [Bryobacteraceae bacterium]|nr:hypothetical protein [Bryobacteraceae bacterium]
MIRAALVFALLMAAGPMRAQYYPYGTPKPGSFKTIAGSFHGKLKELTVKEITIETGEDQLVSIHRTRKTKFLKGTQEIKPSDIDLGTVVTVQAHEEPADLSLTALAVIVDTPKKQGANDK